MKRFDTKVGVIGTGSMGRNHARVYSEIADLVAVCDFNEKSVSEVADTCGCGGFMDIDTMIKDSGVEAVSIATPTTTHADIAVKVFEAGIDVLVEKPISDTVENGRRIIEAAERNGRSFAVGMIERHNPVVAFTKDIIDKENVGNIVSINSRRVSNFPTRIHDVGVITDLGVHDIDVIRYLAGGDVQSVYALGGKYIHDKFIDHATILMKFDNGIEGIVEVSWLTPMKTRSVTITGLKGVAEMDYVDQEVRISSSQFGNIQIDNLWKIPQNYDIKRMRVRQEEPLKRELIDFLDSRQKGKKPMVTGEDGLKALMIAKAAEESIKTGKKVEL